MSFGPLVVFHIPRCECRLCNHGGGDAPEPVEPVTGCEHCGWRICNGACTAIERVREALKRGEILVRCRDTADGLWCTCTCTRAAGHTGDHEMIERGERVATWARAHELGKREVEK